MNVATTPLLLAETLSAEALRVETVGAAVQADGAGSEASWLAPLMFAVGCGVLTAILLRRSYRYFGRRGRRRRQEQPLDAQPRPTEPWSGAKQDVEARFNREKVELHELARDLNGQIDSKLVLLRELIAQSEAQATRLEALLAEVRRAEEEEIRG